jgi:RHS repeat-associated protein
LCCIRAQTRGGENIFEQINNTTGTITYLHHDQAGSTRLLTGSTGTVTGKCSYGAYGTPTCEGSATTPLGYDGEYTSADTGLVYMRARVYDPATAQFLSVDPLEKLTRAPYNFAEDNPLNESDPTGLGNWLGLGIPSPGEVLFPGGGSTQVCVGGTVSFGVTVSLEGCYVHTPHGEGITITPSVGLGAGAAVNGHFGIGESNACRPSEYGGLFNQGGGSAEFGTGGYYNRFSSFPYNEFSGSKRVEGWTTGGSVGLGAEGGGGISDTVVIPLGGGGSGSSGCGCS